MVPVQSKCECTTQKLDTDFQLLITCTTVLSKTRSVVWMSETISRHQYIDWPVTDQWRCQWRKVLWRSATVSPSAPSQLASVDRRAPVSVTRLFCALWSGYYVCVCLSEKNTDNCWWDIDDVTWYERVQLRHGEQCKRLVSDIILSLTFWPWELVSHFLIR